MRKLKKALSVALALAVSLSLAVPAFAAGSWGDGDAWDGDLGKDPDGGPEE